MDLLWMILLLFVVCAEAKNQTVIKVELGQDVTLNCTSNATSIYWYMEIHSQFRAFIGRTFSGGSGQQYFVSPSITKFVLINGTSLMIRNVTADDCRLYFCGRKIYDNISPDETFHIVSDVPVTPSTNSSGAEDQQQQHIWRTRLSELVIFIFFFVLIFLLLVVIGFSFVSLCLKKKKNCTCQVNEPSASSCDTGTPQEIHPAASEASQSAALPADWTRIYYEVKPPGSTLPRQRHL